MLGFFQIFDGDERFADLGEDLKLKCQTGRLPTFCFHFEGHQKIFLLFPMHHMNCNFNNHKINSYDHSAV